MGAEKFWRRARNDIASANRRVLIQAMTFEGDKAGRAVADALLRSEAKDRRVLVDDYTRVNINDTSLASARAQGDARLHAEVIATSEMFEELVGNGVPVRVTNPITAFRLNYPCRNHKKLVVADRVSYIGGVNFSEHNFSWPDLMLRIDDAQASEFLAQDFERTYQGQTKLISFTSDVLHITSLNGRENRLGFSEIIDRINAAKFEVLVVSPYLSVPFTDILGAAARRGVRVRVLTPWVNNKPLVRDALLWSALYYGFELSLGPVMSHLKGMLIDGAQLVLGSSNFDFASIATEEEFVLVTEEASVILDFQTGVVSPTIRSAIPAPLNPGLMRLRMADVVMRAAAFVAPVVRRFPRTAVDWPVGA